MMRRLFKMMGMLLLAAASALGGWALSWWSFDELHGMRQLERVPQTEVMAIIPGEVNLRGNVVFQDKVIRSPDTGTPCVYYRYHVERYERDSDGDGSWRTVSDEQKFVPFGLQDPSGVVDVVPSPRVSFNVHQSHRRERGDMRYTEYRLDEGAPFFLFGYAVVNGDAFTIGFDQEGSYRPLISQRGELAEREGMARTSLVTNWFGILLLAMAVWFLFGALRLHDTTLYLGAVTFVICTLLVYLSFAMVGRDLADAKSRTDRTTQYAAQAFDEALRQAGIGWDGDWNQLGSLEDQRFARLPERERRRLARIRIDLAQSVDRANVHQRRIPEVFVAPILGYKRYAPLPLPEQDLALAQTLDRQRADARLSLIWALVGMLLGGLMAFFGAKWGFKKIKIKRTCENLPTSTIQGIVIGLVEVNGKAELLDNTAPLSAPLSNRPCVYYTYVISEKQGKNWQTVHNETRGIAFACRDATGAIPVDYAGATVMTTHHSSRSSGDRRYEETRIEVGDALYVLATASIDSQTHHSLRLGSGDDEDPFILANMPEHEVQYRKGRLGNFGLNLGMNGTVLVGMSTLGALHTFGALDYLATAIFACFYLFVCLVILMFNDLVFVRRRVARNWANIDVALKKRFDLINQLQPIVAAYADHEQAILATLASLRSVHQASPTLSPELSANIVTRQNEVITGFRVLRERYPDLGADHLFHQLMTSLTDVEDEIALMRNAYNDAVERYNTRIARIPELFLAKALGFARHVSF
jgi:hypothetical protein